MKVQYGKSHTMIKSQRCIFLYLYFLILLSLALILASNTLYAFIYVKQIKFILTRVMCLNCIGVIIPPQTKFGGGGGI